MHRSTAEGGHKVAAEQGVTNAAWDVELSEYGVEETFTDAMAIL